MADDAPLRIAAAAGDIGGSHPVENVTVDWDLFDADDYFARNYSELRHDDAEIIDIVTEFFASTGPPDSRARAIDVGTGANLYPALAMLPFARTLTLCEHARPNRRWLRDQLRAPRPSWRQFWDAMAVGRPVYKNVDEPFEDLRRRAVVRPGTIFELAPASYDLGTMFFVAESITTRDDVFEQATRGFVGSLVPGAPFAAAFMRDSSGYQVGDCEFPSCPVEEDDVRRCLERVAEDVTVLPVDSRDLRPGYDGMMVATGRAKRL